MLWSPRALVSRSKWGVRPRGIAVAIPGVSLLSSLGDIQYILTTLRRARSAEHQLSQLLLRMQEQGLYQALGFASLPLYASAELDMGRPKLKALLALARRAADLPALESAFREGVLPWTKAARILSVATPDTAGDWVERARHITSRDLERQVRGSTLGESPPDPQDLLPARQRRSFWMEAPDGQVLDRALSLLRAQSGVDTQDLDDGRLLGLLIRRAARDLEQQAEEPPTEPIYRTVVTRCPDCAQSSSPDLYVMDHVQSQAQDDGEVLVLDDTPERGTLTRHRTRRAVLARDGYRCVFPGCTCNLFLQLHHGVPFAQGGGHEEENLFTLCSVHHAALHEGHVGLFQEQGEWLVVHRGGQVEPVWRWEPRRVA